MNPILTKARVEAADVVVVSIGSIIPSMAVIEKVRQINKSVYIIARAQLIQSVAQLYQLGADQVIAEKLEIAIDLFNRVLVKKLYPQKEINRVLTHIRTMNLGIFTEKDTVNQPNILDQLPSVSISALRVDEGSLVDGKTLAEIGLRNKTGVTLLAIKRGARMIEHPVPGTHFEKEDIAYVLGNPEQVNFAYEMFSREEPMNLNP